MTREMIPIPKDQMLTNKTILEIQVPARSNGMTIRMGRIKSGLLLQAPKSKLEAAKICRIPFMKPITRAAMALLLYFSIFTYSLLMSMSNPTRALIICLSPVNPQEFPEARKKPMMRKKTPRMMAPVFREQQQHLFNLSILIF